MDRLTKRMEGLGHCMCGNVIIAKCEKCNDRIASCYEEDCGTSIEVLVKLADYEDTGLTPEQVEEMKVENGRLKTELQLAESEVDDLENEIDTLEDRISELEGMK